MKEIVLNPEENLKADDGEMLPTRSNVRTASNVTSVKPEETLLGELHTRKWDPFSPMSVRQD